ncbi:uncharacterized protein LOC121739476 [Aricia agestis]|uniref:uncharacterized protein LOC121739476 n=1 Tax=Aricia agestis TaxID=91739 RepID=UPI001C207D81|nr:uncharacterized protein LOC121739476 [Aricia agestis]
MDSDKDQDILVAELEALCSTEVMEVGVAEDHLLAGSVGAEDTTVSGTPSDPATTSASAPSSSQARAGVSANGPKRRRRQLSGAGKRRIEWWMARGKSLDEVKTLCQKPLSEFPEYAEELEKRTSSKRQLSDTANSQERPTKAAKHNSAQAPKPSFTEETLRLLADVHFPNSIHLESNEAFSHTTVKTRPSPDDWRRASTIFKPDRVKWAIDSFKPYKTGGEDNIFPALLQQGKDIILPVLLKIFRASFAWGYIPLAWTKIKVSYIPKSGDREKALPKSYRPISLTSFMLKTMEKVVNLHIRDTYLTKKPLHERQHAYQKGKSTETALMDLVDRIDRAIEDKEIALCVFLDIEGAFDNTSTSCITNSLALRDMDPTTVQWIKATLDNRVASSTIMDLTLLTDD